MLKAVTIIQSIMRFTLLLILSVAAFFACQRASAQSFKWLGHTNGIPPFDGGIWDTLALGISDEGTVVGNFRQFNGSVSYPDNAWKWKDGEFTDLPLFSANYISPNGRTILGEQRLTNDEGLFLPIEPVKWELIDKDENGDVVEVTPSVDGSVIELNDEMSAIQLANGKWREVGDFTNFRVNAVSADRSTFVGVKYPGLPGDTTAKAAVWTEDTEIIFPLIEGTEDFHRVDMYALAVSGDGSVVVGYINIVYSASAPAVNDYFAFIWTEENGIITIVEAAINAGIEWDFEYWSPEQATAISTDGRFIAGWGDLDGENIEPWLLELDITPREAIVVNVVGDDADADPNDGVIDVDLNEPGEQISLRAAIEAANEELGLDRIEFDIEGPSPVNLGEVFELPVITDLVEIDGMTQDPSSTTPPIWLQFSGDAGLTITGGDCLIRGLVISGADPIDRGQFNSQNLSHGIVLRELGGNTIDFCFIGTNVDGTNSRSIQGAGVFIDNTPDNTVSNCLLSGNWWAGVAMKGSNAFGNIIEDNQIGTNAAGNASIFTNVEIAENSATSPGGLEGNLGNGPPDLDFVLATIFDPIWWTRSAGGIVIENAPSNVVSRNRISGNNWGGIIMVGPGTTNTVVQSNNLGYDPETESPSLRNVPGGNIRISDSANNLIGGETPSLGNQIHGLGTAIDINGDPVRAGGITIGGPGAINNKVQGNRFRDLLDGVFVDKEASENSISKNNVFLDCVESGVTIQGFANTMTENSFGGTEDVRQARWGVVVDGDNNLIGGESAELGNRFINTQYGAILCGLGVGNTFRYNSHEGSRTRIELWGTASRNSYGDTKLRGLRDPDRNDKRDPDTGGNNQQNYPLINVVQSTNSGTSLSGFLDTAQHFLNTTYTLDFYQSGIQIGQGTVVLGPAGLSKFDLQIAASATPGDYVNATATAEDGSTSEFSRATIVEGSTSTDTDGLSDEVEDLVPNGNASTSSTTSTFAKLSSDVSVLAEEGFGDGNGDGILDSEQDWVTSFPTYTGDFLTIVTDSLSANLVDVSPYGPDWIAFSNITAPLGMIDFGIANFPGNTTVIDILLPINSTLTEIWYFGATLSDPEAHWYEFSYDGSTGAEILDDRIRLHFVDGQRGDTDLQVNGTISTSIVPVQIESAEADIDLAINPSSDPTKAEITWSTGLSDWILEKSSNLSDWVDVTDESQIIDGKETLIQCIDPDPTYFRISVSSENQ
ncbi:right-handed parallel beta-helix repeat-containing protein [Puniceicoccaceae bacterium K14]|nr:right-handed parallel beta-helix repeat-containing protein [Puniceicoccaceae bacterium K14]